ncbi:bifunctional nuclease family protein [Salsipaludibacter albus]|uniref:bifunctional nuclease family protein n=1 Tax=Salsipaludibacter albus TaxID=2849650 RepID=UPI001EE43E6D|nr:bifunctional nuclease family protein [Salsipaludibacter albus]
MKPLELVGVRVELPANQPIVLLKETDGPRYLPIWIGAVEATAIAFALQGVETARPLTHDLIVDMLESLGQRLDSVRITDLQDGTFYAELVLVGDDGIEVGVSSRPSDALAIAARLPGTRVYGAPAVLDEAGVELDEDEEVEDAQQAEAEVRQFREFLESVTPEDFKEQ